MLVLLTAVFPVISNRRVISKKNHLQCYSEKHLSTLETLWSFHFSASCWHSSKETKETLAMSRTNVPMPYTHRWCLPLCLIPLSCVTPHLRGRKHCHHSSRWEQPVRRERAHDANWPSLQQELRSGTTGVASYCVPAARQDSDCRGKCSLRLWIAGFDADFILSCTPPTITAIRLPWIIDCVQCFSAQERRFSYFLFASNSVTPTAPC